LEKSYNLFRIVIYRNPNKFSVGSLVTLQWAVLFRSVSYRQVSGILSRPDNAEAWQFYTSHSTPVNDIIRSHHHKHGTAKFFLKLYYTVLPIYDYLTLIIIECL